MELKIFRDTLPQGGAGCTVKAELPLETEIRISDDLPPVGKLVKCFVHPVVLQRQLQPGRLTLEGYLRCTVFYQSEVEKGLCQTEQKLPFTRQLELPELAFTAWTAVVEGQTEYLNTRAADPRRIEVRGAYGLVVTVHTQCKTEVITALADGGIEQQLRTLQGVRSVAVLDKLVTLEGELVFAKPPAAVLDITGNACVGEVKLLAGKAVVKGELRVQCAWRAEGDTALQSQAAALPFQQVIDLEGITEDCRCLCVAEPVGFTLSQAESAAAQLTANVMLHLRAWRSYQLQVAVDAFSTRFETELTPQPLVTEQLLCTLNDTATATGSRPPPGAGGPPGCPDRLRPAAGCRGAAAGLLCALRSAADRPKRGGLGAYRQSSGNSPRRKYPRRAGKLRENLGGQYPAAHHTAGGNYACAGMLAQH